MMTLNSPSSPPFYACWWSYPGVYLPFWQTDVLATWFASRGCSYSLHRWGPKRCHLPLRNKQCHFWCTCPASGLRWNITQYYAQKLFIFAHLEVKTTETGDRVRKVLASCVSSWLEIKISMLTFVLWVNVSSWKWWKGYNCGPGILGHIALCRHCH